MSRRKRSLSLREDERRELERVRDTDRRSYLRERAAALLKVASGQSVRAVAEGGLLKRHEPETVSEWLNRYEAAGIAGLTVRAGRGRKAKFSPSDGSSHAG